MVYGGKACAKAGETLSHMDRHEATTTAKGKMRGGTVIDQIMECTSKHGISRQCTKIFA